MYITLVVMILMSGPALKAEELKSATFVPADKAAHLAISATATTACALVGRLIMKNKWLNGGACFLTVNGVGLAKEFTDASRGGTREANDFYANLAGSTLSLFAISVGF